MKTILIADDEAYLRTLVRTTLDDPRFNILEARDGKEALDLARAHQPALMILDWMMPELTGIEVGRRIRADQTLHETPIILLTARGQEKDLREARAIDVKAYLIKPFSPLELLEHVEALVE